MAEAVIQELKRETLLPGNVFRFEEAQAEFKIGSLNLPPGNSFCSAALVVSGPPSTVRPTQQRMTVAGLPERPTLEKLAELYRKGKIQLVGGYGYTKLVA